MPVRFESSHVEGDFRDGRLNVRVIRGRTDVVWFSVPPDFHTHNDCVAAALLTLVGRRFSQVEFNFSISRACAEILAWYYQLAEVGPVDDGLEPRRPGRYLALNFSGGVDSTALWVLLRDLAGVEFKVVTTEYENNVLDPAGYLAYQRDVSSETNLRTLRFDQDGRFNCAVPLLFAAYADLRGLTNGHNFEHHPYSMESLADGRPPALLVQDAVLNAGGLAEVHIARCLTEIGLNKILVEAAPERIERALNASDFPGKRKRTTKSLAMRHLFEREGRTPPAFLTRIAMPIPASGRRLTGGLHFRTLWEVRQFGLDFTSSIEPRVWERDLSFMDALALDFFERYNTSLIHLIPHSMRNAIIRGLHAVRIYPYAERDFHDLEAMMDFIESDGDPRVAPSLLAHGTPPLAVSDQLSAFSSWSVAEEQSRTKAIPSQADG